MISIRNLSVQAGNFQLQQIHLEAETGKINVLLGPTGSGKTLLLESIVGLYTPAAGTIHIDGKDMTLAPPEARRLAYFPQDNALFPHLDVYHNIAFGLQLPGKRMSPKAIDQSVSDIAGMLDISHLLHRHIARLSGGERQRVALARALLLDHPLFILDEPTDHKPWADADSYVNALSVSNIEFCQPFDIAILSAASEKSWGIKHLQGSKAVQLQARVRRENERKEK
jgi:ABC-type sugar transport system ATPase subunit